VPERQREGRQQQDWQKRASWIVSSRKVLEKSNAGEGEVGQIENRMPFAELRRQAGLITLPSIPYRASYYNTRVCQPRCERDASSASTSCSIKRTSSVGTMAHKLRVPAGQRNDGGWEYEGNQASVILFCVLYPGGHRCGVADLLHQCIRRVEREVLVWASTSAPYSAKCRKEQGRECDGCIPCFAASTIAASLNLRRALWQDLAFSMYGLTDLAASDSTFQPRA
jgi:hypothetical protein